MSNNRKLFYLLIFLFAFAVNFAGINVKFFTDDQGLYASIAKNMIYRNDYFNLFTYGHDWLDKPHFPFWATALSFKLFGISAWAYRLPALLFFLVSLLYTYLLSKKYYGSDIAITAVLITMTALNVVLANTDVRAEPYLMAFITGSIYHIARLDERFYLPDLLLASLLTACAIMTKGVFVLTAIYGSLLGQLLFNRRFGDLLHFKWLALLLLTTLFTMPEIYALYRQFDMHPEKVVFGTQHVSGIRWFLWDSQFGRFVNNGPIIHKGQGSILFYLHTLLWAFAPWCLLFYYALFKKLRLVFGSKKLSEYYTFCGGISLLLLFSFSRFQLPFYTNAVFPLFAVITAPLCFEALNGFGSKFRLGGQWLYIILLPLAILVINFLLKPGNDLAFAADCVLFGAAIFFTVIKVSAPEQKAFFFSCSALLFAGFYLNSIFFNEITPYKGQIAAANFINSKEYDDLRIYSFKDQNNIFQFYCKRQVGLLAADQFKNVRPGEKSAFYADGESMDYLMKNHVDFKIIKPFVNYPQENILPGFIRKTTRKQVLDRVYLISSK